MHAALCPDLITTVTKCARNMMARVLRQCSLQDHQPIAATRKYMAPKTDAAPLKNTTELPSNRGIPSSEACGFEHDDVKEREAVYAHIKAYSHASWGRACWELFHTLVFFCMAWQWRDTWIGMLLIALIRVRIFIIFHDCAHDAYFPSSKANVVVGTFLNMLHHVSFSFWARGHNHHHRHSNNTKYDQYSQSNPWTLRAYNAATKFEKFMYRATYTPLAFLFVMPWLTFGMLFSIKARWWENALNAVYLYFAWQYEVLTVEAVTWAMAAGLGFYMFHLQHTFEGSYRWTPLEWSFFQNGMMASSFMQVPWFLKYFTANIEFHHIHHLSPLVPLYKLPQCHAAAGKLFDRVPRVGFLDGFKLLTPMVWDEDKAKFQKLSLW